MVMVVGRKKEREEGSKFWAQHAKTGFRRSRKGFIRTRAVRPRGARMMTLDRVYLDTLPTPPRHPNNQNTEKESLSIPKRKPLDLETVLK